MARVPTEELERLKKEVSLERLVTSRGVALQKRGDDLVGQCPFHDDKTPSLVVSPQKNLWHCLGACRIGGSVVDWVMKAEGVSFRHAVELLREGATLAGPVGPRLSTVRKLPPPVAAEANDAQLLSQVTDYYHQTMKAAPEAWAYLEKRGLKSEALVDEFRIGFSNRTLGLRLPHGNRESGALLRGRLQKLGVMRDSGHEHFVGSLVVPLLDEAGVVVGMYGRKASDKLSPGASAHLYLPGPRRAAFNSAALAGQTSVILCEAILDAMSFWVAGFRNVTSAYGVEGFTPHHLDAFKGHGVKDVFIAYDRDDAGDAAAEALSKRLLADGFNCWRVQFPKGMDANEYAVKVQPAAKSLGVALRKAAWMGNGATPGVPEFETRAHFSPSVAKPLAVSVVASTLAPHGARKEEVVSAAAVNPAALPATDVGASAEMRSPPGSAPPSSSSPPPLPRAPEIPAEVSDAEVVLHFGPRRYRVRGLSKALSPETLKVNVLVSLGEAFHVDTLDMYSARQRAAFVRQASEELRVTEEILKRDMGALLLKLEALQEEKLKEALSPKTVAPTLSDDETTAALSFLKAPNLLERIVEDFNKCGVVGEESNKLLGYLAAVSRKLEEPLAVLIQSSSAAGKSSLMEAVLAFVPEEDKVKYSAMTGQSLFYMGDADLKHKVLAVAEEEGAARASYALKLLQSEGELTIASTGKDAATGRLVTHEYRVEGPTQLFLTTTSSSVDEELLNRCLVLTVDEERAQTKAIHEKQREKQTLEGLLSRRDKAATLKLHQNAQRLLRPLLVANPFAHKLTFLDDRTRARRDFPKYLTLIRTIALLHQHQRPTKTVQHGGEAVEYVEVQLSDISTANRLASAALGKSLDELPPQTRRLLTHLHATVKGECETTSTKLCDFRFTRREVRAWCGLSDVQARLHLKRLVEFEYLLVHRGQRGQSFIYELLFDGGGTDGPLLPGLLDVEALRSASTTPTSRGEEADFAGASRPQRGASAPTSRGTENTESASEFLPLAAVSALPARNALLGGPSKSTSYVQALVRR